MKKSYLCTGLALACALALSACGGSDDGQLQLSVTLNGVTRAGLQISNKGAAALAVAPGPIYVFPDLVPVDSDYDIAIVARPTNTDSCVVVNGKGNTGVVSPGLIRIDCVITTFPLGGSVTGLTADGLVVNNGSHSVPVPKNATTFTMTAPTTANPKFGQVPEGVPYGLTVLAQPTGLKCTIAFASGTMPAAAVNNIAISCTPTP